MNLMANGQDGYAHHLKGSDKTMFKCSYRRPTDFGMHKVSYPSVRNSDIKLDAPTEMTFNIDNTADLLLDTHLVVDLPNIWSPIHADADADADSGRNRRVWRPFEVRWVRHLGSTIISDIEITVGNLPVQRHIDGHYMRNLAEREFSSEKKALYDEMIGNVPELYDPAAHHGGHYPHASHLDEGRREDGDPAYDYRVEPSIRGRQLIIPIMAWYYFSTKQAVPLCCLRESGNGKQMSIKVTLRPLREWYVLKCVESYKARTAGEALQPYHEDSHAKRRHVSPMYTKSTIIEDHYKLHYFLKEPPSKDMWNTINNDVPDYINASNRDALQDYYKPSNPYLFDVNLVGTTATLEASERNEFLWNPKHYLFKQIVRKEVPRVPLINKYRLEDSGHAANVSIFMQRDDVHKRNEFDNYTSQSYLGEREEPLHDLTDNVMTYYRFDVAGNWDLRKSVGSAATDDYLFRTTGKYALQNHANILRSFALHFGANAKETVTHSNVVSSIDRFMRCGGGGNSRYLHFYTFELDSDPFNATPSGYMNTEHFNRVELEYTLMPPPINKDYQFITLCDPDNNIQLVDKKVKEMYEFNYNMFIYIERWQKLTFENGEVSLVFH